jgi:hypothetical protein
MEKSMCKLVCFLFALLLVACQKQSLSQKEVAFIQLAPVKEWNATIKFWSPEPTDLFTIGDPVHLSLENFSEYKVIFPRDNGIKIYQYDEGQNTWLQIENKMRYIPPGNTQVSPKSTGLPGVIGIGLLPELRSEGKPIEIRVVVVGNLEKNNELTNEQVGAYIDITLQP